MLLGLIRTVHERIKHEKVGISQGLVTVWKQSGKARGNTSLEHTDLPKMELNNVAVHTITDWIWDFFPVNKFQYTDQVSSHISSGLFLIQELGLFPHKLCLISHTRTKFVPTYVLAYFSY